MSIGTSAMVCRGICLDIHNKDASLLRSNCEVIAKRDPKSALEACVKAFLFAEYLRSCWH